MSLFRSLIVGSALAVASLSAAAPAGAVITTFATYEASSAANIYWQKAGTSGGDLYTTSTATATTQGSTIVNFTFLDPVLATFGPLKAIFTLTGHTANLNPAVLAAGFLIQPVVSGSFSFIYAGTAPLTVGSTVYHTGDNLLSAAFTNAAIVGGSGATSGSVSASTASDDEVAPTIEYTSAFLDFSKSEAQDFSLSLTSITSALNRANSSSSLRTFRASSGGAFSSDPAPTVSAVPEPAAWALLLVGFAATGVQLRRSKRRAAVA